MEPNMGSRRHRDDPAARKPDTADIDLDAGREGGAELAARPLAPLAPLALRAGDAARALGISSRALWTLTNAGEIPHARIGRTIAYPVDALREWLKRRAKGRA
jgi:excisionase family DNA binding protein